MKVLHLISSGGMFGAERVILNLASQNNGVICWIGALRNQHNPHLEILEEAKRMGLKTFLFDSQGRVDFKTIFHTRRFLKENNIDILHSHNYKSDIIGFLATRFSKTQWVVTNHVWHGTDAKMRFYEGIDNTVLKFAKIVCAVSQEIKDDLIHKGFKKNNLYVVHNGISISQFNKNSKGQELRKSWNLSDNDTLINMTGRLAPEKGHEILFKALKEVTGQYPHVKCLVVGDGPLKKELEVIVNRLELTNHIIFTGIRKDTAAIYSACDIMVNSSLIEGLPMTILEAMASRLALIATRVGAVPQVIKNEKNGILLEPGNEKALAQAIIDLMNNPVKRHHLAEEAYKDVCEHFSDQRMANDYKKIYEDLLR